VAGDGRLREPGQRRDRRVVAGLLEARDRLGPARAEHDRDVVRAELSCGGCGGVEHRASLCGYISTITNGTFHCACHGPATPVLDPPIVM